MRYFPVRHGLLVPMTRLARLFPLVAVLAIPASAQAATSAPAVHVTGAAQIAQTSATLTGTVDPNGLQTTYYYEYGTAAGQYTARTGPASAGAGSKAVAAAAGLTGLSPATTYHFRLVAGNAKGTRSSIDHKFTTQKQPLGLNLLGSPNPVTYGGAVSLLGQLTGTGSANHEVHFQSKSFPYTADWADATGTLVTGSNGAFGATIPNLLVNTQFRAVTNDKNPTASPPLIVGVAVRVKLSLRSSHVHYGHKALFSGFVTPANDGALFYIQRLKKGQWINVASGSVRHGSGSVSRFVKSIRARHAGAYRVVVGVNNQNTTGASPTVHLHVIRRHHH